MQTRILDLKYRPNKPRNPIQKKFLKAIASNTRKRIHLLSMSKVSSKRRTKSMQSLTLPIGLKTKLKFIAKIEPKGTDSITSFTR